jgi:hypothetical protein
VGSLTTARITRPVGLCGRGWSLVALALCAAAVAGSVLVSLQSGDAGSVRWPLFAFPVAAAVVPVLLPHRNVRIGAAIVMGCWCAIAAASVGIFFVPAELAIVAGVASSDRRR